MGFNDEQKQQIKDYFDSGAYGIIARTTGWVKDSQGNYLDEDGNLCVESKKPAAYYKDWHMVTEPEWRWDLFEYRAYMVLSVIPDETEVNPLFVFGYGYRIYYNEWSENGQMYKKGEGRMYNYTFDFDNNSSIFNGDVQISGDFRASGILSTIGTDTSDNTTLTIIGKTHPQGSRLGPKIRFENEDGTNFLDLVYTDSPSPSLTMSSSKDDEVLIVERESVTKETVANAEVENLNAANADIENLMVTDLTLRNVADVLYPVGSYYWSTSGISPATLFGGEWVSITDAFLYAATTSDPNAVTAVAGEATHVLTVDEIPTHTHTITDPGHTHVVHDPGHGHMLNDPGHTHGIRTIGDDYNGSNNWDQRGTGNFVGDGHSDRTEENWRRGIYAVSNTTGISLSPSSANVTIDGSYSKISIDTTGGSVAHNNMPPYIRAFCWHRVK